MMIATTQYKTRFYQITEKSQFFYSQLNHLQWRVRDLVQVSAPLLPVLQQAEEHGSEGFVRRALRDFLVHVKKKDGTHF